MKSGEYHLNAAQLTAAAGTLPWPVGVIALEDLEKYDATDLLRPPCPLIGIGSRHHPCADVCDIVLESGFSLDSLIAKITRNPNAAAVTVQLLRVLPSLAPAQGLDIESIAYAMLQGSAEHDRWKVTRKAGPSVPAGEIITQRQAGRLDILLDRPAAGNAIDAAMRDGLAEAFAVATLDNEIEEVTLRASGRAFCLGAELSEFGTTRDPASAHAIRLRTLPARQVVNCANKLKVEIGGACVGAGLELAAFAARIEASAKAWFQLPELAMGILPGAGGCVSLTRRIGRQRTALLILSGRRISASKALEWGLVDTLVDAFPSNERRGDVLGQEPRSSFTPGS